MPVIMKDNVQYAYTTKGTVFHTLSNAEYEALSEEEKMNGDVYCIPDREPVINPDQLWEKVGTGTLDIGDDLTDGVNQLNSSLNTFTPVTLTATNESGTSDVAIVIQNCFVKNKVLYISVILHSGNNTNDIRISLPNAISFKQQGGIGICGKGERWKVTGVQYLYSGTNYFILNGITTNTYYHIHGLAFPIN